MNVIDRYYKRVSDILTEAFREERENIEAAADAIARANEEHRSIFGFGCNHAGLVTLELFYRSGGMVTINPIRAPGMMLEISPATMTSQMERMQDYGRIILDGETVKEGDVIIIHSISGRNAVTVDMAEAATEKGMTVIVLTNMNTATSVTSRHKSGKMLHDFADILINNHGDLGDASVELAGFPQKLAPTSTVVGAALLNAAVVRASEILLEKGIQPPVFMSGNIDGGDTHNKAVIAEHKDNIFYM